MSDPDGALAMVRAASGEAVYQHGSNRVTSRTLAAGPPIGADATAHVLGVEQSNSSVIVDGRIAKLVRRIEPGLNPDVELPTHLAEHGFEHAPGVLAALDVDLPGESQPATVMVVHEAVDHQSDLWIRVLDDLSLRIDDAVLFAGDSGAVGDAAASTVAALVGQRTAELHHALAGIDSENSASTLMRPEPFNLQWQRSIVQTVRNSVRATQRELRRHLRSGGLGPRAAARPLGCPRSPARPRARVARARAHGIHGAARALP
jgi:maltose alpha-D-glucosyltransferase/alpha-amylase